MTSIKIPPYSPPARLIRGNYYSKEPKIHIISVYVAQAIDQKPSEAFPALK